MFLEKQLKHEFNKKAQELQTPQELDQQIYQRIAKEPDLAKGKSGRGSKGIGWLPALFQRIPKVAIVALAFLLFTGFAFGATQLFLIEKDHVQIEVKYDKGLTLVHTSPEELLADLREVQNQLAPGESAIVYLPKLEKEGHPLFKQFPFVRVSQLVFYENIDSWIGQLDLLYRAMKQPTLLPDGFTFEAGTLGQEFMGPIVEEGIRVSEELKNRATGETDWEKLDLSTPEYPTLSYKNEAQEEILVSSYILGQDLAKLDITLNDSTTYELVDIRGNEGFYTNNPDHILSQGNVQELTWTEKQGETLFQYTIHTESPHLTMQDLMLIAENME